MHPPRRESPGRKSSSASPGPDLVSDPRAAQEQARRYWETAHAEDDDLWRPLG